MYGLNDAVKDYYNYVVNYLKQRQFFDEDVFQDTVLKCFQVFQKKEIHKNNVVKYFLQSYKLNWYLKDNYKQRMLLNDDLIRNYEAIDEAETDITENHIDYIELRDYLFKKYGEKNYITA